jgi:hypothetical protein
MTPPPSAPNVEAQRAAMKRLDFLTGRWSGEARILRGPGQDMELIQTEEVHYKLEGLVLMIEGVGRMKDEGKAVLQALGIISYDDVAGSYRMRAFNDGRWLETDVRLTENGKGLTWGFAVGEIRTNSVLSINDKGEWRESTDLRAGLQPSRKFMELVVKAQE